MLELEHFMPMAYFKKEAYTGSQKGMRYYVKKEEDMFEATVYPQPFSYGATEECFKTKVTFPYNEEGRKQVVDWLNEQYESRKSEWDKAAGDRHSS